MNNIEKNIVTAAAVGIGGIILGFQGLKKVVGCGHTVAEGLRWTADQVDAGTDFATKKCDDGIAYCEELQAVYVAEAAALELDDAEEVVEAKKAGNNPFLSLDDGEGDVAIA